MWLKWILCVMLIYVIHVNSLHFVLVVEFNVQREMLKIQKFYSRFKSVSKHVVSFFFFLRTKLNFALWIESKCLCAGI